MVGAVVAIAAGFISLPDAASALGDVASPLLFLVMAAPLAVTLDDIGMFAGLAAMIGGGRHLIAWLWLLGAGVVIVFNLDAAVVLLTPLYIRIAQRNGLDTEALAFQPALLACLASGVLPVSNERVSGPVDPRALRRGLPIVGFVLVGFTLGDVAGIDAWAVALVALVWSTSFTKRLRWRAVPVEAIAIAAGLVVLVAAARPHLGLARWFDGGGQLAGLRAVGAATVISNSANNLPTALAASSSISTPSGSWPILIGTNIGSIFVLTGSLSTLLWRDTALRNGVHVTPRRWSSVAVRVGVPALLAATTVHLLLATSM